MMQQITKSQFYDLADLSKIRDYPNVLTVDVMSKSWEVLARRVDTENGRDTDIYFASDKGLEMLSHI